MASNSVQKGKLSIEAKNMSLVEFLNQIKTKTNYVFVYNHDLIQSKSNINLSVKNKEIHDVLVNVLGERNLAYSVENNIIIIRKKEATKTESKDKKRIITGIVKDKKGIALPGVSVVIKGTTGGVSTDIEGKFSIELGSNSPYILKFSFVGMKTKFLKITDKNKYELTLEEDVAKLNDIVVTGYQKIEKRKLSSSVVSVKLEDVKETGVLSLDNMLQGKIAGMTVMNSSATAGAAPKIRIRGSSSITGNREPVWVVDGVILDDPVRLSNEELNSMDRVNLIGNAISFINPEDIERIDILKDASATAVYGVKAANGVIVVSTKKGKFGKPQINYSTSVSFMKRPNYRILDRMNSQERIEVSEEMHEKGLFYTSFSPSRVGYEGALMDYWDKKINHDQFREQVRDLKNTNTDWYDILFRNTVNTSHNISLSGASSKTNYYASIGYSQQNGLERGTDYDRYNAMLKINSRLSEKLSVNFTLNSAATENKRLHSSVDPYTYAYNTSRAIKAYNSDGSRSFYAAEYPFTSSTGNFESDPIKYNILHEMDHTGNTIKNSTVFATIGLNYNIIEGLKFNSMFNYSKTKSNIETWTDQKSFNAQVKRKLPYGAELPNDINQFYEVSELPQGGELSVNNNNTDSYTFRNSINFSKDFKEHHIGANAGLEIRSSELQGYSNTTYGYLPERGKKFADISLSQWEAYREIVNRTKPVVTDTENNYLSYYGILTYAFRDKYILNFNIRADGSNKFGKDKSTRFLPVWSISGRYNLSDEKFVENIKWLNNFSLRASYGIQGNVSDDQTPNLILKMGQSDDIANQPISTLYKVPNHNLKWEKTKSYNLGVDFAILKGKFSGTVELYNKKGRDQIVTKTITGTNGAENVSINEGTITNKGWELFLSANLISTKDFKWSASFNTSKNYNKITDAGDPTHVTYKDYIDGTIIRNGKSVNSFYSYMFESLDENGYPVFKNFNESDEDGNILVKTQQEAYDRILEYSGKREPDLSGGFSTFLSYKQFSLNAIFAFNLGNKIRLNDLYKSEGQLLPFPQQNMSSEYVKRWRKPGDEKHTNIPVLSQDPLNISEYDREYEIASNQWEMYNKSNIRVVDGSFLRCRSVSLGYSFDKSICQKLRVKALNLSFSASNVFVIKSKDLEGRDPEQVTFGSGSIPPQTQYSFRASVNF
ncbi:MAG: TonB-dependent receptor [Marinifilaceae bacterium]|nr:TonB-dependent receptor [Marinifilaceae bacterium]